MTNILAVIMIMMGAAGLLLLLLLGVLGHGAPALVKYLRAAT